MSAQSLLALLERMSTDEAFEKQITGEFAAVLNRYHITWAEASAFCANDEESLRKLTGSDVSPYLKLQGVGTSGCSTIPCLDSNSRAAWCTSYTQCH